MAPAVSKNQRIAAAIAEHNPGKLNKENRGMLKMTHQQLHDFASKIKRKRKAKQGKGTKANPYARGLGAEVPKSWDDKHKSGEPR